MRSSVFSQRETSLFHHGYGAQSSQLSAACELVSVYGMSKFNKACQIGEQESSVTGHPYSLQEVLRSGSG